MAKESSAMAVPPLQAALIGEFLGTALLVLLGDGVVAGEVLLSKTSDKMMITTAWGLAVALSVYLCGRLSGGHINPAVTLALASRGDFPRSRVLPYWGAQLAGAFVGALLVYADYAEAFRAFELEHHVIRGAMDGGKLIGTAAGGAGVFATYPTFDTTWRNFLSEFLGTAVLLLGVRALTDRRNAAPGGYIEPLALGGAGLGDRPVARRPDRLRHQPGARPRPATRLGPPRLGDGGLPVARRLLLDPDRRPARRRRRRDLPLRCRDPPQPAAGRRAQPARRTLALIPFDPEQREHRPLELITETEARVVHDGLR